MLAGDEGAVGIDEQRMGCRGRHSLAKGQVRYEDSNWASGDPWLRQRGGGGRWSRRTWTTVDPTTHQSGVSARLVVQAVVKVVVAAWEAYHAVATSSSARRPSTRARAETVAYI